MTRLLLSICLVCVALVAGCSANAQVSASKPVRVKPPQNTATDNGPAVTGEVPADEVEKLRAELAAQQGVKASDVKVVSAQAVNWPNGALGCPQPGMMYTQAIVPGYRVELEAAGKRFAYHASTKGGFRLCDSKLRQLPNGPQSPGGSESRK
jgi:hypothetical protein